MILTPGFVDRKLISTMGVEPIDSRRLCPFISTSAVRGIVPLVFFLALPRSFVKGKSEASIEGYGQIA